jgi:hypothetical protein
MAANNDTPKEGKRYGNLQNQSNELAMTPISMF